METVLKPRRITVVVAVVALLLWAQTGQEVLVATAVMEPHLLFPVALLLTQAVVVEPHNLAVHKALVEQVAAVERKQQPMELLARQTQAAVVGVV